MQKSGFFSKTSSSNLLKSHKKYPWGSIMNWEKDGQYHSLKIFQGAKIEILGPDHMPTGIKGATDRILPWKASNDLKALTTCIKHNFMTFWPTLGPYNKPQRPKEAILGPRGPRRALHDPNWPCMVKISSSGIKIVLTCITHNYMSYRTPRRSFRHPWGPQNGPKHHPNGPKWPCMAQIDPAGSKIALMALK